MHTIVQQSSGTELSSLDFDDIRVQQATLNYVRDLALCWSAWMTTDINGYPTQSPFVDGGAVRAGFKSAPPRGIEMPADVALMQCLLSACEGLGMTRQIGVLKCWLLARESMSEADIARALECRDVQEFRQLRYSAEKLLCAQIELARICIRSP